MLKSRLIVLQHQLIVIWTCWWFPLSTHRKSLLCLVQLPTLFPTSHLAYIHESSMGFWGTRFFFTKSLGGGFKYSALRTSETILCLGVTAPTRCVRQNRWFRIFFIFTPTWGNDPIWRAYFSDGLKPPTKSWLGQDLPSWKQTKTHPPQK